MKKLFLPILIVLLLTLVACGGDPAEIVGEAATRGGDVAATAAAVATDVADGPNSEGETEVVGPTEEPTDATDATEGESSESSEDGATLCDLADIPQATQAEVTIRFVNNTEGDVAIIWRDVEQSPPVLTEYTVLATGESTDQETYISHEWIAKDQAGNGVVEYTATDDATQCVVVEAEEMVVPLVDEAAGETFDVDPTQPIVVADSDGSEVAIEANTLVDENGNPPAGDVEVNVYTPEPAEEAAAACDEPEATETLTVWSYNSETGLWEEDGTAGYNPATGAYEEGYVAADEAATCDASVASVSVDVTDEAGNEYGLADGETAEVTVPCEPRPDEFLTVWSYDYTTGLWVEESKIPVIQENNCTAEVSNLSNVNFVAQEPVTGILAGQVVDATNNQPLAAAQVCLQGTDQCTSVDDSGNFTFANLPVGEQTVEVTASGHLASTSTATVIAEETVQQVVALSPELAEGVIRIILTWPTNTDTDSYLRIPNIENLISYGNRGSLNAEPFANLDIDSFGFGPETITISQLKAGTYEYWVSVVDSPSYAGAQVKVFDSTGLVAEFDGPTDERPTLPWHVFDIDGATGNIISVNALETFE